VIEFGTLAVPPPLKGGETAAESEAQGFDVQLFGDSQCLGPDAFGQLGLAAAATKKIKIMTGVTNLATRHPSVVASAFAALQIGSEGRAICGVGRGDSALLWIGQKPPRTAAFERDVGLLRNYLDGKKTNLNGWDSHLRWLPSYTVPRVPLDVFSSGARSLAFAAGIADYITLSVGAAPERVRWALEIIDSALATAGRRRSDIRVGAMVNIILADDRQAAVKAVKPIVSLFAHMSSFPGNTLSDQPDKMQRVTSRLMQEYDYRFHGTQDQAAPHLRYVDDEFADWFAVAGPPSYAVDRLGALVELGLQHFYFTGGPKERLAKEVIPQVRGMRR